MKRRILLVDDELAILLTLKAVLEMNDFEVETASSAREARSKLRAGTFPHGDHRHADGERIGRAGSGSGSEASFVSTGGGHADGVPGSGSEWRDEGMDEMLVKPMNIMNLLRQIEALLVTHEDKKQKVGAEAERACKHTRQGRRANRDTEACHRKLDTLAVSLQ